MKKLITLSFAVVALAVSAQDTVSTEGLKQNYGKFKSKRGVTIFPEKGEFALGISANPFLNYFGNMFNNSTNNSLAFNSAIAGTVYGKYMASENTAYRLSLGVNSSSIKDAQRGQLNNTGINGIAPSFGENSQVTGFSNVNINVGIEKRRGKDRVKGIYGAQIGASFGTLKTNNSYVNPIIAAVPQTKSTFNGNTFGVNAGVFVGVEYFFAPKISIGGELGYNVGVSFRGRGEQVTYNLDASTGLMVETKTPGGNNYNSTVGFTTLPTGTINLMFYF